jgi:hypothetical protein
MPLKMFRVKEFADQKNADRYSGSADIVIAASNIAANLVDAKRAAL